MRSEWDKQKDHKLKAKKLKLDAKIKRYKAWNSITKKYKAGVPFVEWVKAYVKSETEKYEPGELLDVGTAISIELNKTINKQNLEDEKNSLAFYYIK